MCQAEQLTHDSSIVCAIPITHGEMCRLLFQQIVVHRCSRDIPASGDQPDGKGDVSRPRVGAQRRSRHTKGVRRYDPQRLCWSRCISYIYPALDEVDAATHCQPLCSPVTYESVAILWVAVSFTTQTGTPSFKPQHVVYGTPTTPDMPSLSYLMTSSASSASPPNPPGIKDSFKVGDINHSGYPTFTINHFNGPVTYSSKDFLSHNLDSLDPDFVSLLCGSIVGAADAAEGAG
jgi:hypothetical protein